MLTARGWWLLIAGTVLAVVGVTAAVVPSVAIVGLSLVAWMIAEWIVFAVRSRFTLPALIAERTIWQNDRVVHSGWAGVAFRVQTRLHNRSRFRCPVVEFRDCGSWTLEAHVTSLHVGQIASSESIIVMKVPGVLHFAGVHLRLRDSNGFFSTEWFIANASEVAVLPALTADEGRQRSNKRFNSLPPPGTHRLRMPGTGSELLDLRDYRPGDPPKTIAWKASARRDRLITKEYESDVPVRCVLFLDTSNSVRIGDVPPLTRLATAAAGILLAATANRDLVGLTLFDAAASTSIAPSRRSSHATRLLNHLAYAAALLPEIPETDPLMIVDRLEPLLRERMPHLFALALNGRPIGLFWRPLLDRRFGGLILLPFALAPFLAIQHFWLDIAAGTARALSPGSRWLALNLVAFLIVFGFVLSLPSALASLAWLGHGLSGFLPGPRRRTRRRKQIAAILAANDGSGPASIEKYLRDDVSFAARASRCFQEHHSRVPVRRYADNGRDRFHEPTKVVVLADALLRATARSRDNELYVILADLIDVADTLGPLMRAVKLARGRHHTVLVIAVWPHDASKERDNMLRKLPVDPLQAGLWRRYDAMRRVLTTSGATVLRLTDRDTVRTIMLHLDRVRGVRSRR